MVMKRTIMLILMLVALRSVAQEIAGRVLDEKKQPVLRAALQVYQGGILKGGNVTDYDGNYTIKSLEPGMYDLLLICTGYDSMMVKGILVSPANRTEQNFNITRKKVGLSSVVVTGYKVPLVNHFEKKTVLTREQIYARPTTEVTDIATTNSNVYQGNRGRGVNIGGSRGDGTQYIIDGVVVRGSAGVNVAQGSVDNLYVAPNAQYDPGTASYKKNPENDFMNVKSTPVSTMSVDVDRASYSNVRRFINEGNMPPADAVRVEEMVNYFNYDYPQPDGDYPIEINTELTTCPWQEGNKLLRIGIQAVKINTDDLPPSNLVFLIDISGSMDSPERLPLLVAGMKLLVQQLRAIDKGSIVTYAGNAGLALPPTNGNKKEVILAALNRLEAGGSTAGGAGIKLAYKVAIDNFIKGGNNRVLLATDGDFNVGVSSDNELENLIVKERESGVFLTCLGFGTDNFKDAKMEMMADKGNGNYSYIDNLQEAQKTLVSEFGGTLFTVAKDVKAQIEFNPAKVQGYRLVGYEDRLLNTEDFKDDKKDAGDMGSGHTVTVLYEIIPRGVKSELMRSANDLKYQLPETTDAAYSDELATIKFRYKKPDGKKSMEISHPITSQTIDWDKASENTRFASAVAMFGMMLKSSKFKGSSSYDNIVAMAITSLGDDKDGYQAEFIKMVKEAKKLDKKTVAK